MSTTGWIFFLSGGPISWSSKKQGATATSATEAEYMALYSATKEAVWLKQVMSELIPCSERPIPLYCDNQAAIRLVKHRESLRRLKHVDVEYHYTCEKQFDGSINVQYVPTNNQLADQLTKALPRDKFHRLKQESGILSCNK